MNQLILRSFAHNYGADLQITGLKRADGGLVDSFEDGEGRWSVHLFDPLPPNHDVNLLVTFTLSLPNANGPLGWNARQTNFIDWYPFIPPFFHSGFYEFTDREPALVGEYQVYESADFNVHLELANAPGTLTVAAAGLLAESGGLDFRLENARRFAWSASHQYSILTTHQDAVLISSYFFEDQRDAAEAALEIASQAVENYAELFGPYPYKSLSIVEATFADGLESDGLFFLDQFYYRSYTYDRQNYLTALTVHEVAHNWWFGLVGSDQAQEPWLDEALATYSELLYYERTYPALVDWWWEFRINRFAPSGWVDSTIYDHLEFSPYVHAVYMRGALFLHEVREAMGDEAFFGFLREYATQGAGEIVSRLDFFTLLSQVSSVDLDPLITKYFESASKE
ncbi:MAG: M1 family aminopeptidase [Anaerolineales bacterium]